MRSFFTALQFLTRIRVVRQDDLSMEDFSRAVAAFPLVGVVLGLCYLLCGLALGSLFSATSVVYAAVLVLLPILLTGGLHCDGFMDAADGLFSGRSRARSLEIMKDSRAGSFGVVAFGSLLLFDFALVRDLSQLSFLWTLQAVFLAPVFGRMAMVLVLSRFPYAREAGMGKAFHDGADRRTLVGAFVVTLCVALPWSFAGLVALFVALSCAYLFGRYAAGRLGGLTGDLYGATALLAETSVLSCYWVLLQLPLPLPYLRLLMESWQVL